MVPTLEDLAGSWQDLTAAPSAHVNESSVDLPTVSNFWGSAAVAPAGVRPVDILGINALELFPFVGCGASAAHGTPYGCGRLLIDGAHVSASAVRYRADETMRRGSSSSSSSSLTVQSATRMAFEQNAVLWELNLTNPTAAALSPSVAIELGATLSQFAHVDWVNQLDYDPTAFRFTTLTTLPPPPPSEPASASASASASAQPGSDGSGAAMCGVLSEGTANATAKTRPAAAVFAVVGVGGSGGGGGSSSGGSSAPCAVVQQGAVPTAHFSALPVAAHSTVTLRLLLAVGSDGAGALALASTLGGSDAAFDGAWAEAHSKWQDRWASAFDPAAAAAAAAATSSSSSSSSSSSNGRFSGMLPTLAIAATDARAAPVERVFYLSALTVVSLMRTNLPLVYDRVFTTSQGSNNYHYGGQPPGGVAIGGATQFYWVGGG